MGDGGEGADRWEGEGMFEGFNRDLKAEAENGVVRDGCTDWKERRKSSQMD